MRDIDYRYVLSEGVWLALAFLILELVEIFRRFRLVRMARLFADHARLWMECRKKQLRALLS